MKINKIGLIAVVLIVFVLLGFSLSCKPHQLSYFPVQKDPQKQLLLLQFGGILFIDNDGYLRVKAPKGKDYSPALVIWPYGYSWKIENNKISIVNEKGQAIMRVGDTVTLGGGFIPGYFVNEITSFPLPADAVGPYFEANP